MKIAVSMNDTSTLDKALGQCMWKDHNGELQAPTAHIEIVDASNFEEDPLTLSALYTQGCIGAQSICNRQPTGYLPSIDRFVCGYAVRLARLFCRQGEIA